MRFDGVPCGGAGAAQHVFAVRYRFQVRGVHARVIATSVVKLQASRHLIDHELEHGEVGGPTTARN